MKDMTLREVCEMTAVSRRAIQGYEKAGLVAATGKNVRGYLLYDEAARDRIQLIKLFQQLGFSIKEIKAIIDAPGPELKAAIEQQIEKLHDESRQMELIIARAYKFMETL